LDEYWFVVGGGESCGDGAGGGIVPVVWAMTNVDMTDVEATTAIMLTIAATRKLNGMVAPR
jgi:hypothetical protein